MTSQPSNKRTNINIHNATKPSELGSPCLQQHGFLSLENLGCSQPNKALILVSLGGAQQEQSFVPSEEGEEGNATILKSLVQILTKGKGYQGNEKCLKWGLRPTGGLNQYVFVH